MESSEIVGHRNQKIEREKKEIEMLHHARENCRFGGYFSVFFATSATVHIAIVTCPLILLKHCLEQL